MRRPVGLLRRSPRCSALGAWWAADMPGRFLDVAVPARSSRISISRSGSGASFWLVELLAVVTFCALVAMRVPRGRDMAAQLLLLLGTMTGSLPLARSAGVRAVLGPHAHPGLHDFDRLGARSGRRIRLALSDL